MTGLDGKVAFVTGGASGIGRAIADRLAEEGARLAIADLDVEGAIRAATEIGRGVLGIQVDISNSGSVYSAVAQAVAALGPIDVLVNNAGWEKAGPFVNSSEETWDKLLAINLRGPITCARAVLDQMIERRRGKILSIASDAGRVGSSGEAVYAAAKAGIIGFSKSLAREVARYGINVNVVAPGPTDTPLFAELVRGNAKLGAALEHASPFGRLATPAEIAAAVAFLASDDANFVTGQTLSVSGGLTMI